MLNIHTKNTRPVVFILLFLGLFVIQSYVYHLARGTWVEHWLIDEITVKPSALLLDKLLPKDNVQAHGQKLVSQTTSITVLNGCEGTESMFLLIAAILAFRAAVKHKLAGIFLGVVFIFLLNQIRIVSLFIALKYNREWFHWLHAYIGPTLIIIFSCIFFLSWLHVIRSQTTTA